MAAALSLALVAFAFTAGLATFANPCNLGLLPAYVGYFAGTESRGEGRPGPLGAAWAGTRFGGAASLGILAFFTLLAGLIVAARRYLGLGSGTLAQASTTVGVVMGVLLVSLGGVMISQHSPSFNLPVRAPEQRTLGSMFVFGILFALAGVGCTLPVFLGVVGSQLLAASTLGAAGTLVAFGAGIALPLLVLSVLASLAQEAVQRRLRGLLPHVKRLGGGLLILAGGIVLWYYLVYIGL